MTERPPLGPLPRYIWEAQRIQHLAEAIQRYVEAGLAVSETWIEEYNELLDRQEVRKREQKG